MTKSWILAMSVVMTADALRFKSSSFTQALMKEEWSWGLKDECLDLNSDKFPLKVNELLESNNMNKSSYFQALKNMGIDEHLAVVGSKLHHSCLKKKESTKLHLVFVGDSTMRQTHIRFLEQEGLWVSEEERNARLKFFEDLSKNQVVDMNEDFLFFKTADDVTTSYIPWVGKPIVSELIEFAKGVDPNDTLVFWMGNAIHALYPKHAKKFPEWWQDREGTVRSVLTGVKEQIPTATLVWDVPNFLDFNLMSADPPKPDIAWIRDNDAMHLLGKWAEIDKKLCNELGVAVTDRFNLGRHYRGIAADGMHYDEEFNAEKNWDVFYDLVLQSGYSEACLKKPANFCKDLETDYDISFDQH